jgi:hypothetical protein
MALRAFPTGCGRCPIGIDEKFAAVLSRSSCSKETEEKISLVIREMAETGGFGRNKRNRFRYFADIGRKSGN